MFRAPSKIKELLNRFFVSKKAALLLTAVAWFWTAHELDIVGIESFDMITKRFPGELWILAAVLTYMCAALMPKNLSVRAFTGVLMLFPASLFRLTRLYVPESGFAMVHIMVVFAYICAVIGMYGMFYPWRIEKALMFLVDKTPRTFGAILVLVGIALITAGIMA
ncbi:MAG: hypothetical protein MJ109_04710 [Kiritimatiellae bacterium]|nr:hypothetical protein [Kiritimatiellia bacterium]